MAAHTRFWVFALLALIEFREARGFSLLGPFAEWMTPSVGFVEHPAYDLGGPRNLGDEFRWNLPVLTYGFDQEFKDFFGTNGVAAVEEAIAWFNGPAPAFATNLMTAPLETRRIHETARSMGLQNLKSAATTYLLEQLGVANSARFTWVNSTTNVDTGVTEDNGLNTFVLQRNFDPLDLGPTPVVAGARYTYQIRTYPPAWFGFPEGNRIAAAIQVDQMHLAPGTVSAAVGDYTTTPALGMHAGEYFAYFTQDDLGAVAYLYGTNNINIEPLAPGLRSRDGGELVNLAARPGVAKILFQRFDPGWTAVTNVFEDRYFLDGVLKTQVVERVIAAPDILFTAGWHTNSSIWKTVWRSGMKFSHTNATGPGIFYPGVTISFEKIGDLKRDAIVDPEWGPMEEARWGLFDNKTGTPKIFPDGAEYQTGRTLGVERKGNEVVWSLRLISGVEYAVEISTNLLEWSAAQTLVGSSVLSVTNLVEGETGKFFRVRRVGP